MSLPLQDNIVSAIEQLIHFGQRLDRKNYVSSFDGNLSYRLNEDLVLITRSGCMKGDLKAQDFLIINLEGRVVEPFINISSLFDKKNKPSSETSMHLQVYKNQPLAKSVFHAHPPTSIALSVTMGSVSEFPLNFSSELILALGKVPFVDYQRPGTKQMGEALIPFLNESKALILRYHGVICWGEDISEAYRGVERLEHSAEIYFKALSLGFKDGLPEEEMKWLRDLRKKIGFKTL